jgi:DNA invertase Pin-like site-specific DNA recombinase
MNQLRFAPLVRVSSEKSEKKGESLRTQTAQLKQYAKSLGGVIPDTCWQYSGQEHATPGYERKKLDKLLEDARKGLFDAVIVADASRWSRDNQKSKAGLQIFRENGIRFFSGTIEQDLYSPEQCLFLGLAAEIGEYQAKTQSLKSIVNRVERARRGIPTSGNLPYGRTFNRDSGEWGIDPEKALIIQTTAKRYLSGEKMSTIARSFGINHSSLWKTLNHRAGDSWECQFKDERVGIDETVTMKIPRLLDDETINAIRLRGKANKTYSHGIIKHEYLLSRMIFCEHCGYTLQAQTNKNGLKYYRHPKGRNRPCHVNKWVPAKQVEPAVLARIFQMFGDVERIEKAIKKATPNHAEIEALRQEAADLTGRLSATEKERDNVIRLASKGILSDQEVEKQIGEIRSRIAATNDRLATIEEQVSGLPTTAQIKKKSSLAMRIMKMVLKSPEALETMPFERRRKLMEKAFAGTDKAGNRLGVYVKFDTGDQSWRMTIRGILDILMSDIPGQTEEELTEETEGGNFPWH